MPNESGSASIIGFGGGLLLSTFGSMPGNDIAHTIILGVVGTISSFIATLVCKWIYKAVKDCLKRK